MEAVVTPIPESLNNIAGGPPKSQVIGTWNPQKGLHLSHKSMFERRKNLTQVTVVNSVLTWAPLSIVEGESQLLQSGIIITIVTIDAFI